MKKLEKGQILIKEGAIDREFYVLMRGRFGVYKNGKELLQIDTEGSTIGELSGILQTPRSATVIALEEATVIDIDAEPERLMKEHPDIAMGIMLDLAKRVLATTNKYAELTEVFEYTLKK